MFTGWLARLFLRYGELSLRLVTLSLFLMSVFRSIPAKAASNSDSSSLTRKKAIPKPKGMFSFYSIVMHSYSYLYS